MKRITFYGNCQMKAIENSLSTNNQFSKKYTFSKNIPPVYLLTSDNFIEVKNILKNTDIFIYQTISNHGKYATYSTDKLLKILSPNSIKICLPDIYFTGFHPGSTYAFTSNNFATAILPPTYHDLSIMKLFMENISKEDTLSLIKKENFFSQEEIERNFKESMNELKLREDYNQVDIKISSFIEQHKFSGIKLFYTFNHPTDFIIKYLSIQILKLINKHKYIIEKDLYELSNFNTLTHKSVEKYFNMNFQETIKLNNKNYDLESYINYTYNIYNKNIDHIKNTFNYYLNAERFNFNKYIIKKVH